MFLANPKQENMNAVNLSLIVVSIYPVYSSKLHRYRNTQLQGLMFSYYQSALNQSAQNN